MKSNVEYVTSPSQGGVSFPFPWAEDYVGRSCRVKLHGVERSLRCWDCEISPKGRCKCKQGLGGGHVICSQEGHMAAQLELVSYFQVQEMSDIELGFSICPAGCPSCFCLSLPRYLPIPLFWNSNTSLVTTHPCDKIPEINNLRVGDSFKGLLLSKVH